MDCSWGWRHGKIHGKNCPDPWATGSNRLEYWCGFLAVHVDFKKSWWIGDNSGILSLISALCTNKEIAVKSGGISLISSQ